MVLFFTKLFLLFFSCEFIVDCLSEGLTIIQAKTIIYQKNIMEQLAIFNFITFFDNALHNNILHDTQLHNIKRWKERNLSCAKKWIKHNNQYVDNLLCDFSYFVACCAFFCNTNFFPEISR